MSTPHKVYDKSIIDKLGVEPDSRVAVLGVKEETNHEDTKTQRNLVSSCLGGKIGCTRRRTCRRL